MKNGRRSVKGYEHGSCVVINNIHFKLFIWKKKLRECSILYLTQGPGKQHCEKSRWTWCALFLMKVTLLLNVLYGLLAGSLDQVQSGLISDIFRSQCPVLVCHFGFSFYLCCQPTMSEDIGVIYGLASPWTSSCQLPQVKQPWQQSHHLTWWLWGGQIVKRSLEKPRGSCLFFFFSLWAE